MDKFCFIWVNLNIFEFYQYEYDIFLDIFNQFSLKYKIHRNPTPSTDTLITSIWPRYTRANEEFMDIGDNMVSSRVPYGGRLHPWHDFQNRFNPWYP